MRVLITGANGFIGKNLVLRVQERGDVDVLTHVRHEPDERLAEKVAQAEAIIHLAGENRPNDEQDYERVNVGLTTRLCELVQRHPRGLPVLFASSTQAELNNSYGRSKLAAEQVLHALAVQGRHAVFVYRLPGVFGKWGRPNYNSVVSTFCHNIANDLPIQISDAGRQVTLVYVDDVIDAFLLALRTDSAGYFRMDVEPRYTVTLGALAEQINAFRNCRDTLISERVGTGLTRALYATYVSYLPPSKFSYEVPAYEDQRGIFVEMLKTPDSGQFSFFTAHPGVTRGGHYHHTKTEKFLVIKGRARFGFRHMLTNDLYYLETAGNKPQVVETVPGWAHDITNIGDEELVVMLWASEVFDRSRPDTIASKVER